MASSCGICIPCASSGEKEVVIGVSSVICITSMLLLFPFLSFFSSLAHPATDFSHYHINRAIGAIIHRRSELSPCSFLCPSWLRPLFLHPFYEVSKIIPLDLSLNLMYQLVAVVCVMPVSLLKLAILVWVPPFWVRFQGLRPLYVAFILDCH